jgi:uncharacterized protein YdaU (DUF1376 family)
MMHSDSAVKGACSKLGQRRRYETMPVCVHDMIRDATDLTPEAFTALTLLRSHAWLRGAELPDDDAVLARYTHMSKTRWLKIRPVMEPYFQVGNGVWIEVFLSEKLGFLDEKYAKIKRAGSAGGNAKSLKYKETAVADAVADASEMPGKMPGELRTKNKEENKKEEREGARATRWAAGRVVDDAWIAEVPGILERAGLPPVNARLEAQKFADHWLAAAGPTAMKADWHAAWRTWVRKAGEFAPSASKGGGMNGQPAKKPYQNPRPKNLKPYTTPPEHMH